MIKTKKGIVYKFFLAFWLFMGVVKAHAIDNPDAPDLIGEFVKREASYLLAIEDPKNSTSDYLVAYNDYLNFLNKELEKAAQEMTSKLPDNRRSELMAAQLNWVKYRDAEFEFIKNTWNRKSFGSSAAISRGGYRASIVRDRILQLLHYTKNF